MPSPNRLLKRVVILAVASLALAAATPITIVAVRGSTFRSLLEAKFANTMQKVRRAGPMRAFALPVDPNISPLEAGEALFALQRTRSRASGPYVFRSDVEPLPPQWLTDTVNAHPFSDANGHSWSGPHSQTILRAATRPLTAEQKGYLEQIANDSAWRLYDRVARAPAVDILGGRYTIPFAENATFYDLPLLRFADTKEFAYASVTRAAAHLAASRPDSAEHALRVAISNGFALNDNAINLIDQLIGVVVVSISRDALDSLFAITNDPRGAALRAQMAALDDSSAMKGDSVPMRGLDFERVSFLSFSPCTSVRGLLFGISEADRAEFDRRRQALARYPSEQALFDVLERSSVQTHGGLNTGKTMRPMARAAIGTASFAGTVFRNPRFGACTALILGN